jgi:hypothetical protein
VAGIEPAPRPSLVQGDLRHCAAPSQAGTSSHADTRKGV